MHRAALAVREAFARLGNDRSVALLGAFLSPLRSVVAPFSGSASELLGGDLRRFHPVAESRKLAHGGSGGIIVAVRSQPVRPERLIPIGVCALLVAAAALSSLPPVGTAAGGAGPTRGPRIVVAGLDGGTGASTSNSAGPTAAGLSTSDLPYYGGDVTITNTLAGAEVGSNGQGTFTSYVVQAGDTLGRVAAHFYISVTTLYWANNKSLPDPESLHLGQRLIVPPIDGLVIVVGEGDTLESIATKYGVASQDIVDANELSEPTLAVGQTLIVPGAETPPLPTTQGATSGSASSASSGGSGSSGNSAGWTGRLTWPVPGHRQINQRFGCTGVASEPPYGNCAHFHAAIDIGAPQGSSVVAAGGGTVIYAGWKLAGSDGYGGGLVVWISHGGKLYTTYNHLSAEFVKVGQRVEAGQRIGSVGMTGSASGPHLHFEVWVCYPWTGGTIGCARNPLSYTG